MEQREYGGSDRIERRECEQVCAASGNVDRSCAVLARASRPVR